jgi:hypothetical protein
MVLGVSDRLLTSSWPGRRTRQKGSGQIHPSKIHPVTYLLQQAHLPQFHHLSIVY